MVECILEGKMACTKAEMEMNKFQIEGNTNLKKKNPTEMNFREVILNEKAKIKRIHNT